MYFFIKVGRDVNHGERMDPIDFGGQRSRSQLTRTEIRYEPNTDLIVMYFFIKLGRDVNHGERMSSIDIGGLSWKGEGHAGYNGQMWGARGFYALCCYIYVCSILDSDTEKNCLILFFCLKMSIKFDTLLLFAFFYIKNCLRSHFSEAHNIDNFGAKQIKFIEIDRTGEMLVQNVCLIHKTLQFCDFR